MQALHSTGVSFKFGSKINSVVHTVQNKREHGGKFVIGAAVSETIISPDHRICGSTLTSERHVSACGGKVKMCLEREVALHDTTTSSASHER